MLLPPVSMSRTTRWGCQSASAVDGFVDRSRHARVVVAVIEREFHDVGEHALFDHQQRASRAAQPRVFGDLGSRDRGMTRWTLLRSDYHPTKEGMTKLHDIVKVRWQCRQRAPSRQSLEV